MRQDPIAILVLAIFVVACDDKSPATGPPPGLQPIAVRVEGPTEVTPPAEVQFTALQTWSDGSTRDVTARAQWASSNPSVLSVSAGRAKALAGGEVGLTAQVEPLTSQPKSVRVVPSTPDWSGTYTLTIGGGPCSESMPLPPALRQRTYSAVVQQSRLNLDVLVANVGTLGGQILNPQVRFFFYHGGPPVPRPLKRAVTTQPLFRSTNILTLAVARYESPLYLSAVRRAAYWGPGGFIEEVPPDLSLLLISGEAITTLSSSGFTGTLHGALSLYERSRATLLGVCASSSHRFTLVRN